MNVFAHDDYREILKALLDERRRDEADVNYQTLAEAIRIPRSYLSKVIHGRADLSVDQLFLAATFFRLSEDERDYLELLLATARTALAERRQALAARIEAARKPYLDTSAHLQAGSVATTPGIEEYYLDPVHQLVHVALDIPRFKSSLKLLAEVTGIALSRLQDAARTLERLGFVARENGELVVKMTALHLPKTSPFYDPWRAQLRLLGLQRAQALAKDEHYAFSVVFSAALTTDQRIKTRFFDFLKQLESEVGSAASERVYQLNFDLLPWS